MIREHNVVVTAPSDLSKHDLVPLARRGRVMAADAADPSYRSVAGMDLNEQLASLLRSQPSLAALTEATAHWIQDQTDCDAAWFENVGRHDPVHLSGTPGQPWSARFEDGVLAGVPIASHGSIVGSLVCWASQKAPAAALHGAMTRASIWLTSALDLRNSPSAGNESQGSSPALRELEERFATVSHELRTPLSTIAAGIEMLLDEELGELTDLQRRMLERMLMNSGRLSELVENATLAPLSAEQVLAKRGADDGELPADACAVLRARATQIERTGRVRVTCKFEHEPVWVAASVSDLEVMIDRVVDNAEKFSPRGAEIELSAHIEGDRAVLRISDQGPGIPARELMNVGTPFYRGDAQRKAETPGAGLGLSLARSLAHVWEGSLAFESAEGRGTRATFRLPHWDQ